MDSKTEKNSIIETQEPHPSVKTYYRLLEEELKNFIFIPIEFIFQELGFNYR